MKQIFAACLLFALTAQATAQTYVVGVEQGNFLPHYGVDEQGQYNASPVNYWTFSPNMPV